MMNINKNSQVEEVLNSLDGCRKATAPDFFYTRLRAKMQARLESGETGPGRKSAEALVLRPVYLLGTFVVLIALNAWVFFGGREETGLATADNDESVQQSIASEYNIYDINTVYDLNRDK